MSTLPNSAVLFPDWKQEINRRVAARKNARVASHNANTGPAPVPATSTRGAKAAERVAARFASAPSYSEMLAREARAAMDAAKAAAKAAEQAQAAFQYVLEGLEAVTPAAGELDLEGAPERNPQYGDKPPVGSPANAPELAKTRMQIAIQDRADGVNSDAESWQAESGLREDESRAYDVVRRQELPTIVVGESDPDEGVEPIYANLIEFPRPMVAARRARPRLAEGPLAGYDSASQLSIFEVDPTAISTAPPLSPDSSAPPSWMCTEWPASAADEMQPSLQSDPIALGRRAGQVYSGMEPEAAHASLHPAAQPRPAAQRWEEFSTDPWFDKAAPESPSIPELELAPLSLRMLAIVFDCTLVAALLISGAVAAVPHINQLPSTRLLASGIALAFLATGFVYHACFFTIFRSTPGMRYAGIEIDTFSGTLPTRKRRWRRLLAMLLSVLPIGLGFLWALFDDENLAWHDHLSATYLRRR